jgi:hypothetical protein
MSQHGSKAWPIPVASVSAVWCATCHRVPPPERCVEACYLQRTRFENITERKLRRRQLTEDGNVEISGRDLRKGQGQRPRYEPTTSPACRTEHS